MWSQPNVSELKNVQSKDKTKINFQSIMKNKRIIIQLTKIIEMTKKLLKVMYKSFFIHIKYKIKIK